MGDLPMWLGFKRLNLGDSPASAPQMLGLQVCVTTLNFQYSSACFFALRGSHCLFLLRKALISSRKPLLIAPGPSKQHSFLYRLKWVSVLYGSMLNKETPAYWEGCPSASPQPECLAREVPLLPSPSLFLSQPLLWSKTSPLPQLRPYYNPVAF